MDVEFSSPDLKISNLRAIKTNLGRRMLTTNYMRQENFLPQWDLCSNDFSPVEMLDKDVPAHLVLHIYDSEEEDYIDIYDSDGEVKKPTKEDYVEHLAVDGVIVTRANGEFGVDVSDSISEYAVKS
eukprot:SAG22_NODE_1140_length_5387_cov_200.511250_3_plen_126_part_00